jgi:hypothetical protein
VLLGIAHAARESASAHGRPVEPPDEALRRALAAAIGDEAFDAAYAEGQRTPVTAFAP